MRKLGTIALVSLALVAAGCDAKPATGTSPAADPAAEDAPVESAAADPGAGDAADDEQADTKSPPAEESPSTPAAEEPEVTDPAPGFSLPDPDGKQHALVNYRGKWVVLEWINHGCPFVKKHYANGDMQSLQKGYRAKGVVWLSICSSAPGKQGHLDADGWKAAIQKHDAYPTAVLMDPEGAVGRAYEAKTTPQMVVIDPRGGLVCDGAIDSIRSKDPGDIAKATNYLSEVLDAVLAGKPSPHATTKPYGCSVKYAKNPAR